jgi:HK97 family phage major capsid protein
MNPEVQMRQSEERISRVNELRDKCKGLLIKAEQESRDLNTDETKQFDKAMAELDAIHRRSGGTYKTRREALDNELATPNAIVGPEAMFNASVNPETGAPLEWRSDLELTEARVLGAQQSFRSYVAGKYPDQAEEYRGLGVGQFLRAAVIGPKNDLERRALSGTSDSAGGYTVPDILGAELIDLLRAHAVCGKARARWVPLDSDKQSFAKWASDPEAGWRAENEPVAESDPTLSRVVFEPKTLAVIVRASRELLEDSLNIEEGLNRAFSQSMSLEVDRVALIGSGSDSEPKGIANTDGVHEVDMGTNGGALGDYDPLLQGRGLILAANGNEPTAIMMAPRTGTALSLLKTGLSGDNRQLPKPQELVNTPFLQTTSLPIDEVHGEADNASRIILGDFRDLWIGTRTSLRVEVLKERYADNLQYGFLAFLRADIGVVRPQSFVQVVGIIPPA